MSTCRRCHRQLKREPWATLGIGKICSQKENIGESKQSESDSDIIIPYDGGDIWIERLEPERKTTSTLRTNIQRIEYKHSPTGFNFGYGGSGPADTALNIMLMFTDKETAHNIYQDFKWEFLGEDCDKLIIPKEKIIAFVNKKKGELIASKFREAKPGELFFAHGRTKEGENIYPKISIAE